LKLKLEHDPNLAREVFEVVKQFSHLKKYRWWLRHYVAPIARANNVELWFKGRRIA